MSYLGIDVGTSRVKAVAFDEAFKPLAESSTSQARLTPEPGRYEIDAAELGRAVRQVIGECGQACRADPIRWISFSVFGGGTSAVDTELRPLLNVISTTDERARPQAEDWCRRFGRRRTFEISGTTTHPSLMLPKILWIDAHLESPQRIDRFVTAAELVQTALGVRPKMDLATASTTMLLDINRRQWSDEILTAAKISTRRLPQLVAPGEPIDRIGSQVCGELGLAPGCVLVAGGHDQQVCALGAGLLKTNQATDSLGTVECITTLLDGPLLDDDFFENNFSNMLHVHGGLVATLAYNFSSGDLFRWTRKTFFGNRPSFEAMFGRMPEKPSGVLVLPHFAGSGTPHLDARSRGLIAGLTLQTTAEEILRGVVDSNNYEIKQNLDIWRRNQITFERLRAYGKGASVDALLQIKADILELEVERLAVLEAGCLGAAVLAALGADPRLPIADVLDRAVTVRRTFSPNGRFADAHRAAYDLYQELYPRMRELPYQT